MSLVLYKKQAHIVTITLNDPERLNAMSVAMGRQFQKHMQKIKNDPSVRVVIITGAGRAFSSGGHLDMLTEKLSKSKAANEKNLKNFYRMFLSLRNIPQPVIAAINGPAIGAGLCLALACDLRYATTTARLGATFARIGLAPGMGGTWLITRLAGPVFASELLLTGKVFDAKQALRFGLINGLVEPTELMRCARSVAGEIAKNGPIALKHIKKGIQKALTGTLEELIAYEARAQAACFATGDIKEGIAAVKARRSPVFLGK